MTYFISGHRDLTWEEFTKWYAPAISKVIMLDSQLPYFIQSDWLKWGLSDEDVEQAIHILNDTNTTAETHL